MARSRIKADGVQIAVADNGIGIPARTHDTNFSATAFTTQKGRPWLRLAQRRPGGPEIWVACLARRQAQGPRPRGRRFTLDLPLKSSGDCFMVKSTAPINRRILVIDDNWPTFMAIFARSSAAEPTTPSDLAAAETRASLGETLPGEHESGI